GVSVVSVFCSGLSRLVSLMVFGRARLRDDSCLAGMGSSLVEVISSAGIGVEGCWSGVVGEGDTGDAGVSELSFATLIFFLMPRAVRRFVKGRRHGLHGPSS